jgi:hypothetical protein
MIELAGVIFLVILSGIFVLAFTFASLVEGNLNKWSGIVLGLWLCYLGWLLAYKNAEKFDMLDEEYYSSVYVIEDSKTVGHYIKKKDGRMIKLPKNLKDPVDCEAVIMYHSELPVYGIYDSRKQKVMTWMITSKEFGIKVGGSDD